MTATIRPMLASPIEMERIIYPAWVQPKLDGIRALMMYGNPMSRSMKKIPNMFIRLWADEYKEILHSLDGELIVCDNEGNTLPFNDIQSQVMSEAGEPNFKYVVFDVWDNPASGYAQRFACARAKVEKLAATGQIGLIYPTRFVANQDELIQAHEVIVTEGYEGSIVRHETATYKYGRSTPKEGKLLKWKVWEDDEAVVTGFVELQHNDNPQVPDAFGLAKRSSHKANQRAGGTLGTLVCDHAVYGTFEIGSGFSFEWRDKIWGNQADYLGKIVTFKYQPFGMKDKPRSPIFKGFRHPHDIGEPNE